jgi:hypothetical protein
MTFEGSMVRSPPTERYNNLVRLYPYDRSYPFGFLAGLTTEDETIEFLALDALPPFDDNGVAKGCSFTPSISSCHEIAFSKRRALDAPQGFHRSSRKRTKLVRRFARKSTGRPKLNGWRRRTSVSDPLPAVEVDSSGAPVERRDCIMDVARFDLRQLQRATYITSDLTDFPVKTKCEDRQVQAAPT